MTAVAHLTLSTPTRNLSTTILNSWHLHLFFLSEYLTLSFSAKYASTRLDTLKSKVNLLNLSIRRCSQSRAVAAEIAGAAPNLNLPPICSLSIVSPGKSARHKRERELSFLGWLEPPSRRRLRDFASDKASPSRAEKKHAGQEERYRSLIKSQAAPAVHFSTSFSWKVKLILFWKIKWSKSNFRL